MKLPKAELKKQKDILNKLTTGTTFTEDFIDYCYEEFNPAILDNLTENGVFFTPPDLAYDAALFSYRHGHVVDVCAGIGMLSYAMRIRDSYDKNIKSLTCIELNPKFVEIGKKLLPKANWICADVFDKSLWDDLVKDLPDNRFDSLISNPPFGTNQLDKTKYSWLNYKGQRDLMAVELCLRYAKNGTFILPSGSAPFSYSGRPYYEERWSMKFRKFVTGNKQFKFDMNCQGIDTTAYGDWKNLGKIGVEVVNVDLYPWSLYLESDSMTEREPKK